jgi:hypothetical protein
MKTLAIGLVVLGFTSLGFAQNMNDETKEIELEDLIVNSSNKDYFNNVSEEYKMTDFVKELQYQAAKYNVSDCSSFDGRSEFFKVSFKGNKGKILATYNRNGKIVKTSERYKDVILPKDIIKSVLSQYPNSDFLKVTYTVNYNHQKDVEKTYKIQIMRDNLVKNLKITSDGNLNKTVTMSIVN